MNGQELTHFMLSLDEVDHLVTTETILIDKLVRLNHFICFNKRNLSSNGCNGLTDKYTGQINLYYFIQ